MEAETRLSTPTESDAVSVAVMTIVSGGLSSSLCDKGVQVDEPRRISNYEHVNGEYREPPGTKNLLWRQDSDRSDSVRSVDQHTSNSQKSRRSGQRNSRRLRRSVSAREGERAIPRPKVNRSISERREHPNRHHRRASQRGNQRGRRTSNSGIDDPNHPSFQNALKNNDDFSTHGSGKINETVAVEIGLAEAKGVSPKETRRRQIVFAVVLISLGILTASVLLVAITLLITPATDNVVRKENQEIYRVWSSTSAPQEGAQGAIFNQTVSSTGRPG
ncbi:uncharacterized protein LOC106470278 [Limulus polyphemus]|uniref:Uncharacterized protein LOC106470278 n=1 Tax=Limulus polyphemus TaxID=6850 RepID=A0ABM1BPQ0_LIMPO|nr:uncharacterized protein LOC106470278 [Limulus polyphemus]